MDKYEFRIKLEQIQKLKSKGDYLAACKIADTIDWSKVKSISVLCEIADTYDKTGKYAECKEVLLLAYDRSPIGRMIVYRLADVNIKLRDLQEAEDCYKDFLELAPRDAHKYVLKYKLEKAKGASNDALINILEDLKANEFSEQWAYELAYLYHKTGLVTKCIEECDDIFLWFGEGKYVEKALELKMLYEPLSPIQKEKYDNCRRNRKRKGHAIVTENESQIEDIKPVEVVPGKYDTVNLQKELAKSMEQIMSATQKEDVAATMDSIKKLVEDSKIPELEFGADEVDANYYEEDSIDKKAEDNASIEIDFKKFLNEEYDGQISLCVPDNPIVEKQITGQMSIEDVLAEWEKTKQAAKEVIERDEQRKLEEVRAHALKKTEVILEKLADIPIETPDNPELDPEVIEREINYEETTGRIEELENEEDFEEIPEEREEALEEAEEVNDFVLDGLEELIAKQIEEPIEETTKEEVKPEIFDEVTELLSNTEVEDSKSETVAIKEDVQEEIKISKAPIVFQFDDKQNEIFTYFTHVRGLKNDIKDIVNEVAQDGMQERSGGHIVITGCSGQGKTKLAGALIKSIESLGIREKSKIGKIAGTALNMKRIETMLEKIGDGYLIVEKAGDIKDFKAEELFSTLKARGNNVIVILEDTEEAMEQLVEKAPSLDEVFNRKINIPRLTNDELVEFGKSYALEEGYMIEEMGVLAVYNEIGKSQIDDRPTTLEEVIEIIDYAIENAKRSSVKKTLGKLFSKNKSEDGYNILRERDFE